jgi:hypothetical protein
MIKTVAVTTEAVVANLRSRGVSTGVVVLFTAGCAVLMFDDCHRFRCMRLVPLMDAKEFFVFGIIDG